MRSTVWVRLFKTDVEVKGSGSVADAESAQGPRIRTDKNGRRRTSVGDRKLQREMLNLLSADVGESSDWTTDEDVIPVTVPSASSADESVDARRPAGLMCTVPVARAAGHATVMVKAEPGGEEEEEEKEVSGDSGDESGDGEAEDESEDEEDEDEGDEVEVEEEEDESGGEGRGSEGDEEDEGSMMDDE